MLNWFFWIRTVWLNWIAWNRSLFLTNRLLTFKLSAYAKLNCLKWNCFKLYLHWKLFFYLLRTFFPHLGNFFFFFFLCCFFFLNVSAKFHLWPSSGDLPRPRIGMLSLVTVSPVITAFHSCCLSHHVFDQVNLWPAWVGFETAIFWQCSPGTAETQRLYPLRHGPRRNNTKKNYLDEEKKFAINKKINSQIKKPHLKKWFQFKTCTYTKLNCLI